MEHTHSFLLSLLRHSLNHNELSLKESDASSLDWEYLYSLLREQALFPMGYRLLKPLLPMQKQRKWMLQFACNRLKTQNDIENTSRLFSLLGNRTDISIAKGFILSQIIYGTPFMRQYSDVDLYSNAESIIQICRKLRENGFCFYQAEQAALTANVDIDSYYSKTVEAICYSPNSPKTAFEIKQKDFSAYLTPQLVKETNAKGTILEVCGHSFPSFDPTTVLFYLMMNAYKNYTTGWCCLHQRPLRDLYDIASWITSHPQYHYADLFLLAEDKSVQKSISHMISLSCSVFDIPYPSTAQVYFPRSEVDSNLVLDETFDSTYRIRRYADRITDLIPPYSVSDISMDSTSVLVNHSIRMPIKDCMPNVYATLYTKKLLIEVNDLPCGTDLSVNFGIWDDKKAGNPFPYEEVHFIIHCTSVHEQTNIIVSDCATLTDRTLRLHIPLSGSMWKTHKNNKCLLFKLSISLPQINTQLASWLTVGLEEVPYMLVAHS